MNCPLQMLVRNSPLPLRISSAVNIELRFSNFIRLAQDNNISPKTLPVLDLSCGKFGEIIKDLLLCRLCLTTNDKLLHQLPASIKKHPGTFGRSLIKAPGKHFFIAPSLVVGGQDCERHRFPGMGSKR